MAYGIYKDLNKRTQAYNVLRDKAFEIASNPKYDDYQRRWFTSFLIKYLLKLELKIKLNKIKNLQMNFIRKFYQRKVYSSFKDNMWGVDLAYMQLISKYNKGIRFLLCAINLFSKYAWVVPIKDKKGVSIVNAFQKNLDKSKRKPNKIWVDQVSEFYNSQFKNFSKTRK